TARKQPNQIRIALSIDLLRLESLDHGVADKHRAESRFHVEIRLERENAEHEIDEARHLFNPAAVPCPDLRADIIDYFVALQLPVQRAGQSQIETRIVNQNDCVGFAFVNFAERLTELLSKIAVLSQHFPQAENRRVTNPILKLSARDVLHLRAP